MKRYLILLSAIGLCVCATAFVRSNEEGSPVTNQENVPAYKLLDLPMVDLANFPKDAEGWITLFDGKTFTGFRGYGKTVIPACWTIEDNAIKIMSRSSRPSGENNRGDLMFAHKFKYYEFEFEWKVAEKSNSGILYKSLEVEGKQPYISSPEYQVLDNENHPDAKLGKDGNRKSASLYDMIPANPQNGKPYGEWNSGKIKVTKDAVTHYQNGVAVVTYKMWSPSWTALLDDCKFSKDKDELAYYLLSNCGGPEREGVIAFQDHGDDAWFRNLRIRIIE